MELSLSSPVQYLSRVGPRMAALLEKLGIRTVKDLIYYIPFRYDDFSLVSPIVRVQAGETVTISGTITKFKNAYTKSGKKLQEATITDETDTIDVIWFNQPYLAKILPVGIQVSLAGKADWFGHKLVMSSPTHEILPLQGPTGSSLHTGRLVPVYPETQGVTSKWLRGRIADVLDLTLDEVPEILPHDFRKTYALLPIHDALRSVHFPRTFEQAKHAKKRLAFEELLLVHLRSHLLREEWKAHHVSHVFSIPQNDIEHLTASLPFTLTNDQTAALSQIYHDLTQRTPMNRLLVGDVGSGKTIIATIAMYLVHMNGFQSILMAPTQILAEQHYQTISELLSPLGITVALVTGSSRHDTDTPSKGTPASERVKTDHNILVGTHALLSEKLLLKNVGLIVIDEQHRFGVKQRMVLSTKTDQGITPHLLTMTATPIPRTVARTMFGNLDLSVLNIMPEGRQRIKTWLVPSEKRKRAYEWIGKQLEETKGQMFIICPLIEDSETLVSVRAVKTEFERLQRIFSHFTLGLLHGRMKAKEKTQVIADFTNKATQILVSTPVVEVGIDIPNANIMVIEAGERFGLGQLHQLRGRVGRGKQQSYCLIFTESTDETVSTRLKSLETIFSGPELAELDLTLRGPGDVFGTKQHGIPLLHIAKFSDTELLKVTKDAAAHLVTQSQDLSVFPLLREKAEKDTIESIQQD